MYPYFTVNGLPIVNSPGFYLIILTELICLLDIIINFFLQEVDESGNTKKDPRSEVMERYLYSGFVFDFVIFVLIYRAYKGR